MSGFLPPLALPSVEGLFLTGEEAGGESEGPAGRVIDYASKNTLRK